MSEINQLAGMLGISPTAVSKRLCFVKGSFLDSTWHIGDYKGLEEQGGKLFIFTLHAGFIPKAVEADSLTSLSLKDPSPSLQICAECADEFRAVLPDIQADGFARFVEFRAALSASETKTQISDDLFEKTFVEPYAKQ